MSITVVVALAAALLVGLLVGRAAAMVERRGQRKRERESRQQAVAAAVAQILTEREATVAAVGADRDRTVEVAVSNAVQVAGVTLDAKLAVSSTELDLRSQSFEQRAAGIDKNLARLGDTVESLRRHNQSQMRELAAELRSAGEQRTALAQTTGQLRDALASPQRRGQWGERMAEDVLQAAGFVEGINYRKQTQVEGGGIPDITFLLPGDLILNMDVKFPVDNYLRYLEADDDERADAARRQFSKDVRARVREIADRGYIDAETTLDVVLLFIPNEAVYAFLHENDADLVDQAMAQKVVLCSPFTLFAVLAVIRQSVDQFRLEKTSSQILVELARVRSEWDKLSAQVTKVGKHLGTLNNSYEELQGPRTNQLSRAFGRIDALQDDSDPSTALDRRAEAPDGGEVMMPTTPLAEVEPATGQHPPHLREAG